MEDQDFLLILQKPPPKESHGILRHELLIQILDMTFFRL
jgi:hypothetical protein